MTTRLPIVLNNGKFQQLQIGDTLNAIAALIKLEQPQQV